MIRCLYLSRLAGHVAAHDVSRREEQRRVEASVKAVAEGIDDVDEGRDGFGGLGLGP